MQINNFNQLVEFSKNITNKDFVFFNLRVSDKMVVYINKICKIVKRAKFNSVKLVHNKINLEDMIGLWFTSGIFDNINYETTFLHITSFLEDTNYEIDISTMKNCEVLELNYFNVKNLDALDPKIRVLKIFNCVLDDKKNFLPETLNVLRLYDSGNIDILNLPKNLQRLSLCLWKKWHVPEDYFLNLPDKLEEFTTDFCFDKTKNTGHLFPTTLKKLNYCPTKFFNTEEIQIYLNKILKKNKHLESNGIAY